MASNETATSTGYKNVKTGSLSDDFLRIDGQQNFSATAMGNPFSFGGFQTTGGVLIITVIQARLAKNYGMTRMDPYCRLRVGVQVFETPCAYNGSKTPRWNKMIQCQIPDGVKDFYIEIYDERTFQVDERVAWGIIPIKDEVFNGETVDDWYSLTGKQGDEKEGVMNIVLQYKKVNQPLMMGGPMMTTGGAIMYPAPAVYQGGMFYSYPQQVMYAPTAMMQPFPQQFPTQQQQQQQPPQINKKDLKTLKEMCPNMDDEIIRTVLHQSGGNVDLAASKLLEMNCE